MHGLLKQYDSGKAIKYNGVGHKVKVNGKVVIHTVQESIISRQSEML
jgi:phage baseplate assembly protein gpV